MRTRAMDDMFGSGHVYTALDDDDLWEMTRQRGLDPAGGTPNAWRRGFLTWYLAGGRD